jgi:YD repeat-containing protein
MTTCKREGEAVSTRQWVAGLLAATLAGCAAGVPPQPAYDPVTRQLTRLDVDANQDGRIDQRTYLAGNTPLRSEMDTNEDGRIDRWEYVDAAGTVVMVGSSSLEDGVEDRWTWPVDADGVQRLDVSSGRTRHVDRREHYRGGDLVRADEDSNEDGLPDKWEEYADGRLRRLSFDSSRAAGRADWRLTYDARGKVTGVERDADGDGRFEAAAPEQRPAGETL